MVGKQALVTGHHPEGEKPALRHHLSGDSVGTKHVRVSALKAAWLGRIDVGKGKGRRLPHPSRTHLTRQNLVKSLRLPPDPTNSQRLSPPTVTPLPGLPKMMTISSLTASVIKVLSGLKLLSLK